MIVSRVWFVHNYLLALIRPLELCKVCKEHPRTILSSPHNVLSPLLYCVLRCTWRTTQRLWIKVLSGGLIDWHQKSLANIISYERLLVLRYKYAGSQSLWPLCVECFFSQSMTSSFVLTSCKLYYLFYLLSIIFITPN